MNRQGQANKETSTVFVFLLTATMAMPDVFFLSVDTLRADRLGSYGCSQGASPALDAFSASALLFEDCLSEIPLTGPSFCSMMASQYPRMLGVTQNGVRIPESESTVAEQFRKAGYQTYCIQSNWPLRANLCGLNRGFDVYDDGFKQRKGSPVGERYADEVTELALGVVEKRDPTRPLFCWVHYSDPHAPYRFHKDFNPGDRQLLGLDRAGQTRVKYDSEVAFADHHIGRFLAAVSNENTFVLFVADHGESLFEHGYLGHGRRIYQASMHIPLMIRGPNIRPGRTQFPARGIDIGPTLLALAGLPAAPGMLGFNLLANGLPEERVRIVETYGGKAMPGEAPGERTASREPAEASLMWQGAVSGEWKLILSADQSTPPQLFDLRKDPIEERNLAAELPECVRELISAVESWNINVPLAAPSGAGLSPADREVLRTLGYF